MRNEGNRFSCGGSNGRTRLAIELFEIAVTAHWLNAMSAAAMRDRLNPRPLGDALVRATTPRHLALEPLHPLGEGVRRGPSTIWNSERVRIGELAGR